MPGNDGLDAIVAGRMMAVQDWAELKTKQWSQPEVRCLPLQRHLGFLYDNCCARESAHWPFVVLVAEEAVVVVRV